MRTSLLTLSPTRSLRDVLLAGVAGALAPYLVAIAWSALALAIWGPGPRLAAFVDPSTGPTVGHTLLRLVFAAGLGALLGAGLARGLGQPGAPRSGVWLAFAAAGALSVSRWDPSALVAPVVVLLIASSALGFRLGARR